MVMPMSEKTQHKRHVEALRCCCASLDHDVKFSSRVAAIRIRADVPMDELKEKVPEYEDMEDPETCENVSLQSCIRLARFYHITLSTLFLNVDIKAKPRFVDE